LQGELLPSLGVRHLSSVSFSHFNQISKDAPSIILIKLLNGNFPNLLYGRLATTFNGLGKKTESIVKLK
jgi:hypothetical protein